MYLSETDGRIHHDFALKRTFPEMPKKIFEKQEFHLFILQSSEPRDAINQDGVCAGLPQLHSKPSPP